MRQQIEGGLVFGMAAALGGVDRVQRRAGRQRAGFGGLDLPRLADMPDITVELIRERGRPGGVSELARAAGRAGDRQRAAIGDGLPHPQLAATG